MPNTPDSLVLFSASLDWSPFPKERPRTRPGSSALYTPQKTRQAEAELLHLFNEAVGPDWTPIEGPVGVDMGFDDNRIDITLYKTARHRSKLRGDLDNYAKTALDALNKVAFVDDRYVDWLRAVKL